MVSHAGMQENFPTDFIRPQGIFFPCSKIPDAHRSVVPTQVDGELEIIHQVGLSKMRCGFQDFLEAPYTKSVVHSGCLSFVSGNNTSVTSGSGQKWGNTPLIYLPKGNRGNCHSFEPLPILPGSSDQRERALQTNLPIIYVPKGTRRDKI